MSQFNTIFSLISHLNPIKLKTHIKLETSISKPPIHLKLEANKNNKIYRGK